MPTLKRADQEQFDKARDLLETAPPKELGFVKSMFFGQLKGEQVLPYPQQEADEVKDRAPAPIMVHGVGALEGLGAEADRDDLEERPLAEEPDVDRPDLARRENRRCLVEVARNADRAGKVHRAAHRQQPERRLATQEAARDRVGRPVAACCHDDLDPNVCRSTRDGG